MMRGIHLDVRLPFDTAANREHSEDILMWLLGTFCRIDLLYLLRNPDTPALYDSGIRYAPPDQLARPPIDRAQIDALLQQLQAMGLDKATRKMILRLVAGAEVFLGTPELIERGEGDCNELVPMRVAELWRAGIGASPYLIKERNDRGGWTYHALVQWPDKSLEDPSLILGMGGAARAADRVEEIQKNRKRWLLYLAAGRHLVQAEGVPAAAVGRRINMLGLIPRDGEFRAAVLGLIPRKGVARAAA